MINEKKIYMYALNTAESIYNRYSELLEDADEYSDTEYLKKKKNTAYLEMIEIENMIKEKFGRE